jgi:hypothetical protein
MALLDFSGRIARIIFGAWSELIKPHRQFAVFLRTRALAFFTEGLTLRLAQYQ